MIKQAWFTLTLSYGWQHDEILFSIYGQQAREKKAIFGFQLLIIYIVIFINLYLSNSLELKFLFQFWLGRKLAKRLKNARFYQMVWTSLKSTSKIRIVQKRIIDILILCRLLRAEVLSVMFHAGAEDAVTPSLNLFKQHKQNNASIPVEIQVWKILIHFHVFFIYLFANIYDRGLP